MHALGKRDVVAGKLGRVECAGDLDRLGFRRQIFRFDGDPVGLVLIRKAGADFLGHRGKVLVPGLRGRLAGDRFGHAENAKCAHFCFLLARGRAGRGERPAEQRPAQMLLMVWGETP